MKKLSLLLSAVVAGLLTFSAHAATLAQIEAWKKEFPAAAPGDSAQLHKTIADYETLVKQITPTTERKLLPLLKSKLVREQQVATLTLHPTKPGVVAPTGAARAEIEAALKWLNIQFAPFLSRIPL